MRILLKISLFTIILGVSSQVHSQNKYHYKFNPYITQGFIYEQIGDTEMELICTMESAEPIFGDIAVDHDGDIYGLTQGGEIRRIDLDSGTSVFIGSYPSVGHTAFTIDSQQNCYTLDLYQFLISYNMTSGESEYLTSLGEITPGDLTFYNGHLVYPSGEGVIKAINTETFEVDTIYCLPPEIIEMKDIWGIYNDFDQCGTEYLVVTNTANEVFRIDVENDSFEELILDYDVDVDGTIYGATAIGDIMSSDCQGVITPVESCDEENPVDINEINFDDEIRIFPNPVQESLNIYGVKYDRLEIFNASGQILISSNQTTSSLNLTELASGLYFIRFITKEKIVVKSIQKI